jgi:hypothetical protein
MPYAMEQLILRGVINDTFETAITWERFEEFHNAIKAATENAIRETTGRKGEITCRFTHVYPDGSASYFTFHALGQPGKLGAQWRAIKSAALDAVIANGGTVTHPPAVGRDHQRSPLFAEALRREEGAGPAGPAQSRRSHRPMTFKLDLATEQSVMTQVKAVIFRMPPAVFDSFIQSGVSNRRGASCIPFLVFRYEAGIAARFSLRALSLEHLVDA